MARRRRRRRRRRRVSRRRADAVLQLPDRLRDVRVFAPSFVVVRLPTLPTPSVRFSRNADRVVAAVRRDVAGHGDGPVQGDVPPIRHAEHLALVLDVQVLAEQGHRDRARVPVTQQVHRVVRLGEPGARSQERGVAGGRRVRHVQRRSVPRPPQALREPRDDAAQHGGDRGAHGAVEQAAHRERARGRERRRGRETRAGRARADGRRGAAGRACGHRARVAPSGGAGHDRPGGARGERGERGPLRRGGECATAASRETGGGADRAHDGLAERARRSNTRRCRRFSRQKPSTWMASIRRRLTLTSTDESARQRGSSLIEARARSKPSLGISR